MIKTIKENPNIGDTILFELEIHNKGLFIDSKINSIKIYYIEQDFSNKNVIPYRGKYVNPSLEKEFKSILKEVSDNPTPENLLKIENSKKILEGTAIHQDFYYRDSKLVYEINDPEVENKSLGNYTFQWDTSNQRTGNYFVIWTWKINEIEISSKEIFFINPNEQGTYVDKLRKTSPDKYEMLMNLYMPSMYKYKVKSTDLTPDTIKKFNKCAANIFTSIEDRANRIIDLLDADTVEENVLPLLANMFGLRLKTNDTSLWRRQIRQSMSLYKRKGTVVSIKEALDQAGINLSKITRLWQVTSNYIWTDGFSIHKDLESKFSSVFEDNKVKVLEGSIIGNLSNVPFGDIEVFINSEEGYLPVPKECILIVDTMKSSEMPLVIWRGKDIKLYEEDILILKYKLKEIPENRKHIEEYIQNLPLSDQRDINLQKYPLKNWNVHLIEEDDPLFDSIIENRHPFADPIVYGKIRTNFMYSEKTYNMDTYDGSLRDSKNPCHIDKNFIDGCSYCQSSSFVVDLEINELSNEKIMEAEEIIKEYSPFHAILHSMNINSSAQEFIPSPEEKLTIDGKTKSDLSDKIEHKENIKFIIEYDDGKIEKGTI